MFRPIDNETSSYADSTHSNGYSTMDEDSQASNLSRPSAKSIYRQRREYSASINTSTDKSQYRVEHLFTCDLNGKELKNEADCLEQLKLLDGMGRVWGQSMLLEVRGHRLLLTDIETKAELDSMDLRDVLELKAVLDSEVFDSLLTVSVQQGRKRTTSVFMFRCEDVRADHVQKDLTRALSNSRNAGPRNAARTPEQRLAVNSWMSPDYEDDDLLEPELFLPDEEEQSLHPLYSSQSYMEVERDVEILNHVLSDIEVFNQLVASEAQNAMKKKKWKKGKDVLLPEAQFKAALQKFKSGFNLLGELAGKINNPSAPQLVHSLFTSLAFVVSHCPETLPPTVVEPLLTPHCIRLMSEVASTEEDLLWQSMGESWNVPSTKWPGGNGGIQTYTPGFANDWQPPKSSASPDPRESVSRQESPQPAPNQTWRSPQSSHTVPQNRSGESKPQHMRVVYDFVSRNSSELSVRKGETVELLDMSRQWWKVRNSRGEAGYVPNNILEDPHGPPFQPSEGPPVLSKRTKPAEVKAWLEYKGFSPITVRCLGGLSGSMLLGMTREELKVVCPEEGGRVFYQLRAVKSAMAQAAT